MSRALNIILIILFLSSTNAFANTRDGLGGWWTFNETSGNAIDSSWQGNTGTPTGTTIVTNCVRGGCRQFNGSNDFVDIGNNFPYEYTQLFTISAWIKHSMTTDANIVSKQQNSGGFVGWGLGLTSPGNYQVFLYNGNFGGGAISHPTSNSWNDGKWHHVVWTYSGNGVVSGFNIYIDGALVALTTDQDALSGHTITSSASFQISGRGGTGNLFAGTIDDVRIYNRVLTAQEIKDLFNLGEFRNN